MNRAMFDHSEPGDEDPWLERLLSEAGDPTVEPRPQFVSALRSTILDRLKKPRRAPVWRTRLLLGSAVAVVAVTAAAMAFALIRPANAWAQVAKAVQDRPWIHTRTLGPDGKEYGESWFSVKNNVSAVRHGPIVEYHDKTLKVVAKYVADEGVVYRIPENPELSAIDRGDFFEQLLDSERPAKSPVPGMEVVTRNRRDVVENGRSWVEIELTCKVVGGDRQQRMRFRVDPKTKLPHSCVFQSIEGPEGTNLFDYPDHGPVDIYDLGAPRSAKIVDRMPSNDLKGALAGLKAGRVRFDDYCGIFETGIGPNVNRMWRKGRKWRVEQLLPDPKKPQEFPKDADAAWWKQHQGDFTFMVQAICDGEKVYYYHGEGNPFAADAPRPPRLNLSMTQAINPSDDPFMPWPHVFPEHVSHPNVWQPTDDRTFELDPKPADGPPGTTRLRVLDKKLAAADQPDRYKLWINPEQNSVVLRAETAVFESTNPPKLAYIDTEIVEALARSPSGRWYPTRVLRTTSNFPGKQVRKYFLDFDAPIPDDLFRPLGP
jgi:hypothetical protein